jgi:hypothetical protein
MIIKNLWWEVDGSTFHILHQVYEVPGKNKRASGKLEEGGCLPDLSRDDVDLVENPTSGEVQDKK